jgi:putative nucleotidyltransferase with HDIG domain
MSSGKKRRTRSETGLLARLERSIWLRALLLLAFVLTAGWMTLQASDETTLAGRGVQGGLVGLVLALSAVIMFRINYDQTAVRTGRITLLFGGILLHLFLLRSVDSLLALNGVGGMFRFLLLPFAFAPMIHTVLLGRSQGIFSTVYVSLLGTLLVPRGETFTYLVVSLVCGLVVVAATERVRRRVQLLRAGIYAGSMALLLALLFQEINLKGLFEPGWILHLQMVGMGAAAALGSGLLMALLISGLLPVLEGTFNLTTDISWLELTDLNHRLLRRMQLEAPGTFHHSLVVAQLAEAAAEVIGANAVMCRVSAYFHDIGKLKKPNYFIENQGDMLENPHDNLTPTMSALVIIAHVKEGVDLAVKHKLNPRVIDVIQEHHGDSMVYYFYRKAQEQQKSEQQKVDRGLGNPEDLPQIEEKNFRYPGPRPRSRESAIVSLADAVESASRSLKKPTPAKIRGLVDDLVQARICDGQLDECGLTLRELTRVKESFASTLRSMMHSRIDYPKVEGERGQAAAKSNLGREKDAKPQERTEGKDGRPESKPRPLERSAEHAATRTILELAGLERRGNE